MGVTKMVAFPGGGGGVTKKWWGAAGVDGGCHEKVGALFKKQALFESKRFSESVAAGPTPA